MDGAFEERHCGVPSEVRLSDGAEALLRELQRQDQRLPRARTAGPTDPRGPSLRRRDSRPRAGSPPQAPRGPRPGWQQPAASSPSAIPAVSGALAERSTAHWPTVARSQRPPTCPRTTSRVGARTTSRVSLLRRDHGMAAPLSGGLMRVVSVVSGAGSPRARAAADPYLGRAGGVPAGHTRTASAARTTSAAREAPPARSAGECRPGPAGSAQAARAGSCCQRYRLIAARRAYSLEPIGPGPCAVTIVTALLLPIIGS